MRSFGRFLRLSASEKLSFLEAVFLLFFARVALRRVSLRRLQAFMDRFLLGKEATGDAALLVDRARGVARLVQAAARRVPVQTYCLHNSLVLSWMLRRRGIPCELRFGARLQGSELDAHAWVECAGQVLNDSQDVHERFPPFDRPIVFGEPKPR